MQGHTVTAIVFTDIESSTRLWETQRAAMSAALACHDAIARKVVDETGGTLVKMTGDGLCAAFADPVQALRAALHLQQGLADPAATAELPLRVRCGVHLGLVERRDNDLFGSSMNRCARIMGVAHGGQVLVSQALAEVVRDRLPEALELLPLGTVRLRDLASPEPLYQLAHPTLRRDFPPLRSLEATPNNLPQQLTSFIGRERELAEAKALLGRTRLLTLLGMGGLGKTRLSLQVAADVMDAYPDGVFFIDLAPVRDAALVPGEVAATLSLGEIAGRTPLAAVCDFLKSRTVLLVLDNCEHLIGASATLAAELLRAAPQVRLLATSREPLRVPGEQTFPVQPMSLPARGDTPEQLARSEAVQLFVERARLQRPDFAVTAEDAPALAQVCAQLDGIPLALELAAARMRSLSVREITTRLQDRFKLLTGGSRVLLERQQTLRALVNWSYGLLLESEQVLLDRLGVFTGGFDLDAAEAVCGADPLDAGDVLDLLMSLVDKSLVMVQQGEAGGGTRYRLLETIRAFAREQLGKRDPEGSTAAAHGAFYLDFAQTGRKKLQGPEQAVWMRRLEAELDNLRGAMAHALTADPERSLQFTLALMRFWMLRGYSTEGRKVVAQALALPGTQALPAARGDALYVGGVLAANQGDHVEAKRMLAECVQLRRPLGKARDTAAALSNLAAVHILDGEAAQAQPYEEEALAIFRSLGDRIGEGVCLAHLGELAVQQDDAATARARFEEALAIASAQGHHELASHCELLLGEVAARVDDAGEARRRFERSLELFRAAEDKRGEANALRQLGRLDTREGERTRARERLQAALRAFNEFEMNAEIVDCLQDVADLQLADGDVEGACRLYGAAEQLHAAHALRRSAEGARGATRSASALAAVDPAQREALRTQGAGWSQVEAIGFALQIPPGL